jgi:diguanylate cyclase (GGDEF)-like protein|tara:strand:- start:1495 stop:3435 length:1941 start_codon:yes stop_codon:yes gene_type:complete
LQGKFIHSFLNGLDYEQNLSKVEVLRAKRLLQVYVLIELTLILMAISRIAIGKYLFAAAITTIFIGLLTLFPLIKKGKIEVAANILCSCALLFCLGVLWVYDGLREEAAIALPSILMFSVVLGGKQLYKILGLITIINALAIGYVNSTGMYVNVVAASSLDAAIIISVMVTVMGIAAWLLAHDLRSVNTSLFTEHSLLLASQQEIEHLVYHDTLTGLHNRAASNKLFDDAVSASKENSLPVYMMYIDLDNFKSINDSFGENFGDKYLTEIANRLQSMVSENDFLCRMGGDEFVLIFNSMEDDSGIDFTANKIQELIKNPFFKDGQIVSSTTSIGIATYPKDGDNFNTIMKNADMAMYYAKEQGKDTFHLFDKEVNKEIFDTLSLISDMRTALKENQFYLVFQPKILLENNTVVGAEALLRWIHPTHGFIGPDIFIPIAEKSGLIIDIGKWVIEQSCIACGNWSNAGYPDVSVAINMSIIQFNENGIVDQIRNSISNSGVKPNNIELEVTESLLLDDTAALRDTLDAIKKMGIKISIDDFGTGYSNLGYLKKMDVNTLKIDRSFIQHMIDEPHNKNIVKAIIQISKSLDLKVIAEGVETKVVADSLRAMNCEIGQGYFWAKPLVEKEFLEFLENPKNKNYESFNVGN